MVANENAWLAILNVTRGEGMERKVFNHVKLINLLVKSLARKGKKNKAEKRKEEDSDYQALIIP